MSVSGGRESSECFSFAANILFFVGAGAAIIWTMESAAFSCIARAAQLEVPRCFQIFTLGRQHMDAWPRLFARSPRRKELSGKLVDGFEDVQNAHGRNGAAWFMELKALRVFAKAQISFSCSFSASALVNGARASGTCQCSAVGTPALSPVPRRQHSARTSARGIRRVQHVSAWFVCFPPK